LWSMWKLPASGWPHVLGMLSHVTDPRNRKDFKFLHPSSPHGVPCLGSCDPRWPTAIFSANSLPSNIPCTDMLCGSQVHGTRISLCKLATLVSYAMANSIVFSMLCFQQTIHPTNVACRNIMNHSSPTCRIILTEVLLLAIIIVRPGSA
jgi:hypothetical protein